jgi:hypothetical protein
MAEEIIPPSPHESNEEQAAFLLWSMWWNALLALRPAFAQFRVFLWFTALVAGITVRTDLLGVTSVIRALRLRSCCYGALLRTVHSNAISLDTLCELWSSAVLRLFPAPMRINGRLVLVGDGIKVAKYGKHMPGVKLLHQESEHKAEFVMGHSLQAVGLLVKAGQSVLSVPLAVRIHEGVVYSNRHKKTLLDKMIALLDILTIRQPFYFVADTYYAARKMIVGLHDRGQHLITRVRNNAVANAPCEHRGARKRGRPRTYGRKIHVIALLEEPGVAVSSPVYGEQNVSVRYVVRDLLWRPVSKLVRFVAVEHPTRGVCLLMSTDVTLDAVEIIRGYGLRAKIEYAFKQAVHGIGTFAYHFWMKSMTPLPRGSGDQYLHRKPLPYRAAVKRKLHAYHIFLQAGVIAQGLLHYLAVAMPELVWNSFGSWLRTIRPGIAPSEFVTAEVLRQSLPEFLASSAQHHAWAKFIRKHQRPGAAPIFSAAA